MIVFTCNHCPVATAYENRLIALDKDYSSRGVQLVAINVNNLEQDKLPAMKERAQAKGFQFPYLYDPSQKVGHQYGAAVTLMFFCWMTTDASFMSVQWTITRTKPK